MIVKRKTLDMLERLTSFSGTELLHLRKSGKDYSATMNDFLGDVEVSGGITGSIPSPGIIMPLYYYPTDVRNNTIWNRVIAVARKYRNVPMITIVNHSNGPGTERSTTRAVGIQRLQGAGITVVGYIYIQNGARDISEVKADLDGWESLYPEITGIFIDEYPDDATSENLAYCQELKEYILGKGFEFSIGNQARDFDKEYRDAELCDIWVAWENTDYPTLEEAKGDTEEGFSEWNYMTRAILVEDQDYLSVSKLQDILLPYFGWVYITDTNGWQNIPDYFELMVKLISQYFIRDQIDVLQMSYVKGLIESGKMGTIVPLYNYPSGYSDTVWESYFDLSRQYKEVHNMIIANPSNGDFTEISSAWTEMLNRCVGAGLIIIGYIFSEYGTRPIDEMKANIDAYEEFYPQVIGFFIDEYATSLDSSIMEVYEELARYIRAKGYKIIVGNPGTQEKNEYFDNWYSDIFCEHESEDYPTEEESIGSTDDQDKHSIGRRMVLTLETPTFDTDKMEYIRKGFNWIYINDAGTWSVLSSHFEDTLKYIVRANQESGGGGSSEAEDITAEDAGDYFTSDNLEGITQEIGSDLESLNSGAEEMEGDIVELQEAISDDFALPSFSKSTVSSGVASSSINCMATNGTLFLVGGDDQRVRYTEDFVTWDNEYVGGAVYAMLWDEDAEFFYVGLQNGKVLSTTDGENYTELADFGDYISNFRKIGTRVYALCDDGYAHYTEDDGASWSDGTIQQAGYAPNDIVNNNGLYISVNNNERSYVSDDGASWEAVWDFDEKLLMVYFNGVKFVVFGNFGDVWSTYDGKTHKLESQLYGAPASRAVMTIDGVEYIILATQTVAGTDMEGGYIYISKDGGYTFRELYKYSNDIYSILAVEDYLYIANDVDVDRLSFA